MRYGERVAQQYDAMGLAYRTENEEGAWNAYYERPATISLIGSVASRRVLEVGCGPGVLTHWLTEHGADVTAIDVSQEMVRLARSRVGGQARILVADLAEPLPFMADASADLVVASLVLHYLPDWAGALGEFYRILAPGGAVVFSVHHPAMDWQEHSSGDYFAVKQVTETWDLLDKSYEVTFWRRPITAITAAISAAGFVIEKLIEPEPVPELRQRDAETDDWLRKNPMFIFFRLRKNMTG
jgi:ubiquinone/menaquinone biosynthesis C-methylase UbiE